MNKNNIIFKTQALCNKEHFSLIMIMEFRIHQVTFSLMFNSILQWVFDQRNMGAKILPPSYSYKNQKSKKLLNWNVDLCSPNFLKLVLDL